MSTHWWECTHADIGLPGCPTCDGRLGLEARQALTEARDEIGRLRAELAARDTADEAARRAEGARCGIADPDDSPPSLADFADAVLAVRDELVRLRTVREARGAAKESP